MNRYLSLILTVVMLITAIPMSSSSEEALPFTDVERGQWFYEAVEYSYTNGIFKGTNAEGTAFSPDRTMTRIEFATTLFRLAGENEENYNGESGFPDVPADSWMSAPASWASEKGYVLGNQRGEFMPNVSLDRQTLATMLYRYASDDIDAAEVNESSLDKFTDSSDTAAWALEAMRWAVGAGLINGTGESTLAPLMAASRAQVSQILMNYSKLAPEEDFDDSHIERTAIGSSRQLMVDDYIIDTEQSDISLLMENAVKREIVFTFNKSYESGGIVFPNIVEMPEGGYRMYYTAFSDRRRVCYIESDDGLNWSRPNLTTNTTTGDRYTNIVTDENVSPSALYVFYDENVGALRGVYGQWADGLFLEHTSDNGDYFRFWPDETKMMGMPGETGGCFFDTLNTVYYDENKGKYVAYVRGFHVGDDYNLTREFVNENPDIVIRDIRYAESDDCINWTTPVPISYDDSVEYQMYANAVIPYYRAPETYIAMPTRFEYDTRRNEKWTDVFFMTSRDGVNWNRSDTPFLAPYEDEMYEYPDCGYPTVGLIETSSDEISFYMDEYSASKKCDVLYRYTVRIDGFMSASGTRLVTKPISFEGDSLEINYEGEMKVTVSDFGGRSVSTDWFDGNDISRVLDLKLSEFEGKAVTVTFEMKEDTKLYSFKFNG